MYNITEHVVIDDDRNGRVGNQVTENIIPLSGQLPINGNGLRPVSYTHLDVYKRQEDT